MHFGGVAGICRKLGCIAQNTGMGLGLTAAGDSSISARMSMRS